MSDSLDDLVGAYRADSERGRAAPAQTRVRLLRSVHRRHARRRLGVALSIVGAIVLSNATTWAWSTGRVDAMLDASFGTSETPAEAAQTAEEPEVGVPERVASDAEDAAEVAAPSLEGLALPEPGGSAPSEPIAMAGGARRPRERAVRLPVETRRASGPLAPENSGAGDAPEAPPVEESAPLAGAALGDALAELESDADVRERRAFQEAHDVHFRRDYGGALTRWDRYLARYPRGRFLPEARYNRAIALLRLSRLGEARAALTGLASSRSAGARRADAQRLLDAMDDGRLTVPDPQ